MERKPEDDDVHQDDDGVQKFQSQLDVEQYEAADYGHCEESDQIVTKQQFEVVVDLHGLEENAIELEDQAVQVAVVDRRHSL